MNFDFPKLEKEILDFWKKNNIFNKLRDKNKDKKPWSFLDGPITANNPMGVHHAWGRSYKDIFQRFKAMQGFDERYQNGFDCQGLWVEVEVEKELGFKNKKDIETYGIDKFVEKCKERVKKYSKIQTQQSIRLGQWMDWDNSYYTMSDENNYAIWGFLKKCREKGYLYKGRDVVPWCPRCGTAISEHEILTEEYKEITHKAVYVKFRVKDFSGKEKENTYFLAWTTTPWTLPANVALALNPNLEYAKVKDKKGDIFILLKDKADLIEGGKIIKELKGSEIPAIWHYEGIFDELPAVKKIISDLDVNAEGHRTYQWNDVSADEGTGIVHVAPGCGKEDFNLEIEQRYIISPIEESNNESVYSEGFGQLTGKRVDSVEAREQIIKNLKERGLIFKTEDYKHRYPTCWRCKTELIFRLVSEWYISMEKLRKPLAEMTKKMEWIPSFGLSRELDWLKNMQDWLISKKRYWGLALPIYECSSCGSFKVIGSKEELETEAKKGEGWNEFEGHSPHKPWIDKVKIRCPNQKCGKLISRIPDVGNPWLDAGIVPFSTIKYFSDKKYWEKWFPPELICESFPGQFKNWFYAILVMSTILEGKIPAKTVFAYASVKDEKGEEMHKSKGNAIWFDEAVEKIGADVMRWMYARQNPAYNLRFGYNVADETRRKILTLFNGFAFFETYVPKEEYPSKEKISSRSLLDLWIISRFNNLIKKTTKSLEKYDPAAASLTIEDFFVNDLSLWYIRRSRRRLQKPESKKEKKEAAETLYFILLNLSKLTAPFLPFLSEHIYQHLRKEKMPESVHLCDWPSSDGKIDKDLEEKMKQAREVVAKALALRRENEVKVRQPLKSLKLKKDIFGKELLELIKDEVNVKDVIFDKNLKEELELDLELTSELKKEGIIREVIRQIQQMRKKAGYKPRHKITVAFKGHADLNKILENNKKHILTESKADKFELGRKSMAFDVEKEFKIDGKEMWLAIKKL